ncbi:class I tRNA ligase family protein [bacterium]|nr:class I tRNA ligase family protein [bacterium]
MSKSLGNVIDPKMYLDDFGSDALRYFLIKELSIEQDSVFSHDIFVKVYNGDLANNYGNMITRV